MDSFEHINKAKMYKCSLYVSNHTEKEMEKKTTRVYITYSFKRKFFFKKQKLSRPSACGAQLYKENQSMRDFFIFVKVWLASKVAKTKKKNKPLNNEKKLTSFINSSRQFRILFCLRSPLLGAQILTG